mmetsp:Transcript_53130/g.78805  ORF Transcript_53130/g.78805 Transcript_53130/m.78805 type:complete len:254 (-) Transcript_53130:9338-10099(-)
MTALVSAVAVRPRMFVVSVMVEPRRRTAMMCAAVVLKLTNAVSVAATRPLARDALKRQPAITLLGLTLPTTQFALIRFHPTTTASVPALLMKTAAGSAAEIVSLMSAEFVQDLVHLARKIGALMVNMTAWVNAVDTKQSTSVVCAAATALYVTETALRCANPGSMIVTETVMVQSFMTAAVFAVASALCARMTTVPMALLTARASVTALTCSTIVTCAAATAVHAVVAPTPRPATTIAPPTSQMMIFACTPKI